MWSLNYSEPAAWRRVFGVDWDFMHYWCSASGHRVGMNSVVSLEGNTYKLERVAKGDTTKWETVGVFDTPQEVVAMAKLINASSC